MPKRLKKFVVFFILIISSHASAENKEFINWTNQFKIKASQAGVSKVTIDKAFARIVFIEKLLVYDRKQPEFIEKTDVYVKKRVTPQRIAKARNLLSEKKDFLNKIENEFSVPKEILIALWGIETNFGINKGKVDILSALATLSFDKRRSEYFSNELLILLKLIDSKKVKIESMYGSWAGAHGNFQFMPSSIATYAIDYDKNQTIDLTNSLEDSFASAANYLKQIGWDKSIIWGSKATLVKNISTNLITTDARNFRKAMTYEQWKDLGVVSETKLPPKTLYQLVKPDGTSGPAYLVSNNYEKLLHWNRSLRFAIAAGLFSDQLRYD